MYESQVSIILLLYYLVVKGFVSGDIFEGIIYVYSIIRINDHSLSYIENGIINKAKNPARTSAISQVAGKPLSSLIRCAISYSLSVIREGCTGATEATVYEQAMAE